MLWAQDHTCKLWNWSSSPEPACFPLAKVCLPINVACATLDLGLGLIL